VHSPCVRDYTVTEQLSRLRLIKSRERLEAVLQEATGEQLSHAADLLDRLLGEEVLLSLIAQTPFRITALPSISGSLPCLGSVC